MRVIPFEFNIERAMKKLISIDTFEVQFLHFDWSEGDTCLFGLGWYQGVFWIDICFWWAIKTKLLSKLLEIK